MKSGTEHNPNPCNAPINRFLRALERPVRKGYVYLRNGQIVRQDTYERMQRDRQSLKETR